jgi:endo-1,4-beta-xylanase
VFERAFGGAGYIADALRTAHAADPTAKLYLNDFNIEGENAKSDAMFNLAQSLLAQGVPLNGIGFESHFILGQVPSTMQANMARFAALGLDVAVTELDDRMQLPATAANLTEQANEFAAVVKDCLGVSRCVGVTQWGVGDADSWIPGAFPGQGAATMYDQNYQPKPAYNSVVAALGGSSTTPPPPPPPTGGGGFCHMTYTTTTEWVGGFVANVTLANPGTTAINGWRVTFNFGGDQHITNAWNATVTQSGAAVTAVNASFDATVPAGGSLSFGFQGTWTNSDAVPTAFSVNGTPCS